eukprot:COSAG03_NODE_558_length_6950_cov_4.520362_6_plen_91_part_00
MVNISTVNVLAEQNFFLKGHGVSIGNSLPPRAQDPTSPPINTAAATCVLPWPVLRSPFDILNFSALRTENLENLISRVRNVWMDPKYHNP